MPIMSSRTRCLCKPVREREIENKSVFLQMFRLWIWPCHYSWSQYSLMDPFIFVAHWRGSCTGKWASLLHCPSGCISKPWGWIVGKGTYPIRYLIYPEVLNLFVGVSFIHFSLVTDVLIDSCDFYIQGMLQPVEVTFDAEFFMKLFEFFDVLKFLSFQHERVSIHEQSSAPFHYVPFLRGVFALLIIWKWDT